MALNFCNNNSLSSITALPASISGGGLNLISTSTITSSTSAIEITSGLDSTYKEYIFKFINLHPVSDGTSFQFQASTDGGSSYGVNKTSTFFEAEHDEGDSSTALQYNTTFDRGANSTDYITLLSEIGDDADQSGSGTLHLFDPSNTTFVKHYIANTSSSSNANFSRNQFIGGYFNTTSAINALKFEMRTGNIEKAVLKMYGVS
tara:strand:+ start:626 stop:1237 length:612 start_codon:yes stop_codon:yes gene_type:complete